MTTNLRFAQAHSPLLPIFDHDSLAKRVVQDLTVGHAHAAAIAMSTVTLMEIHTGLLITQKPDLLIQLGITKSNLDLLTLGFRYPLDSLLASSVCLPESPDKWPSLFEEIVGVTHNFDTLRSQEQIRTDLRATINLLKLDPSGSLVFQFLKDYPFSRDEFFLTGMEIAAIVFFGISLMVADITGDHSRLNTPLPAYRLD